VLASLHGLDALRRVQPRLCDDDKGVKIGLKYFVERSVCVIRIELVMKGRLIRELRDALRLAVTQRDSIDKRVALEQIGESASKTAEANQA